MRPFPTISKQEKSVYGHPYYASPATKAELLEFQKNGQGAIGIMFAPIYDRTLRDAFAVPVKWQNTDNAMYFPSFSDILHTQYDFLMREMRTQQIKQQYKDPSTYALIMSYMAKWKAKQPLHTTIHNTQPPQQIEQINNPIETHPAQNNLLFSDELKRVKNISNNFEQKKLDMKDIKVGILIQLNKKNVQLADQYPFGIISHIHSHAVIPNYIRMSYHHVKTSNGQLVEVENSRGWIELEDIDAIICADTNHEQQLIAYQQQQIFATRNIAKNVSKKNVNRFFKDNLQNRFGTKFKQSLNPTNHTQHRKKQKITKVEQEAYPQDVDELLIPKLNKKNVTCQKIKQNLNINIQNPNDLTHIIGAQNIMNTVDGNDFIPIYPFTISFGYALKYPKFKTTFRIAKAKKIKDKKSKKTRYNMER